MYDEKLLKQEILDFLFQDNRKIHVTQVDQIDFVINAVTKLYKIRGFNEKLTEVLKDNPAINELMCQIQKALKIQNAFTPIDLKAICHNWATKQSTPKPTILN